MMDVGRHPNIQLTAYSEVESVSGYVGSFTVRVRKKTRYVDANDCTACGDCVPVCPVTAPDEFQSGLSTRKAIYMPSATILTPTARRSNGWTGCGTSWSAGGFGRSGCNWSGSAPPKGKSGLR